jgi:hypothetical protein
MHSATKIILIWNYVNEIDTRLPGPHPVISVINPGGGNRIEGLKPGLAALNIAGWYWECEFQITNNPDFDNLFII